MTSSIKRIKKDIFKKHQQPNFLFFRRNIVYVFTMKNNLLTILMISLFLMTGCSTLSVNSLPCGVGGVACDSYSVEDNIVKASFKYEAANNFINILNVTSNCEIEELKYEAGEQWKIGYINTVRLSCSDEVIEALSPRNPIRVDFHYGVKYKRAIQNRTETLRITSITSEEE